MMVAVVCRYLRQPIDLVEEWEVEKFLAYHDAMAEMMEIDSEPDN